MNKHLIRFVSLLLVPCLVGDALFPAGAATYKNWNAARIVDPSLPAGQILRTALQNVSFIPPQNPFTEEALSGSSLETTSVMLLKNDVAWAHRRFTHTAPWAIAGATWWGRLHADLFSGGSAVRAGKFDGQLKYLKEEHDIDLFPFRNARRADPEEAFKLAHEIAIRVAPIEETNHYLRDKLDEMIGAGLQLLRQGWKPEDIALHLLKERLKVMLDEHAGLSAEDITILAIELFEWTFPLQKTLEHFFSLPLEEAFDYLDAHEDRLFSEIVDKHAQYNDDISKLIRKGPLAITGSGPSDEPAVDGSTNLVTKLEKTAKSYVNMMNAGQTFTFEHVRRFRQNLEAAIENAFAEMFLQSEIVPEDWMEKWDQALEGSTTPHFKGLLNRELLLPFGGPYIYVPEGQDLRVEIPLGRWRWPIGGPTIWIVLNAHDTESGFLANDGIISLDGQTILQQAGIPEWVPHATWATCLEEIGHVTDWMVFEDLEQRGESILKLIEFKSDLEQYATRSPSKNLENDLTEVAAGYRSIIHAADPLSLAVSMIQLCSVEGLPASDPHYWAAHFMREEIIRLLKLPEQPSSDAELQQLIEKRVGHQDIHDIRRRAFEAMKVNLRLPRDGSDPAGRGLPIFRPGQDPTKDDEFSRIVENIIEALAEGFSQGRLAFPERKQPKPTPSAAAPPSPLERLRIAWNAKLEQSRKLWKPSRYGFPYNPAAPLAYDPVHIKQTPFGPFILLDLPAFSDDKQAGQGEKVEKDPNLLAPDDPTILMEDPFGDHYITTGQWPDVTGRSQLWAKSNQKQGLTLDHIASQLAWAQQGAVLQHHSSIENKVDHMHSHLYPADAVPVSRFANAFEATAGHTYRNVAMGQLRGWPLPHTALASSDMSSLKEAIFALANQLREKGIMFRYTVMPGSRPGDVIANFVLWKGTLYIDASVPFRFDPVGFIRSSQKEADASWTEEAILNSLRQILLDEASVVRERETFWTRWTAAAPNGGDISHGFSEAEKEMILKRAQSVPDEDNIKLAILWDLAVQMGIELPAEMLNHPYHAASAMIEKIKSSDLTQLKVPYDTEKSWGNIVVEGLIHFVTVPLKTFSKEGTPAAIQSQEKFYLAHGSPRLSDVVLDEFPKDKPNQITDDLLQWAWQFWNPDACTLLVEDFFDPQSPLHKHLTQTAFHEMVEAATPNNEIVHKAIIHQIQNRYFDTAAMQQDLRTYIDAAAADLTGMVKFWNHSRLNWLPTPVKAVLAGVVEPIWYHLLLPVVNPSMQNFQVRMRKFLFDHGDRQTENQIEVRLNLFEADWMAVWAGVLYFAVSVACETPHSWLGWLTRLAATLLLTSAPHLFWNINQFSSPNPIYGLAEVPRPPAPALGTPPKAERVATDYLEGMLQDLQQHLERLQNRMADPRSARAIYSDNLDDKVIALLEDMSRSEHPWDLVPELRRQYAQLLVEVILNFPYRSQPSKGQNPIPIVEIAEVNLENLLSDQSRGSLDHQAVVETLIAHESNLDEAAMGRLRSGQAIVVPSLPSLETLESIQRAMGNRELTFSVVQPSQISHPLLILSNDDAYYSYPRLTNYASTIGHTHGYLLPLSPSPLDKSSGRQYAKNIGGQEFILGFSKGQWIEMLWRSPEQNAWHKITDRRLISAKLQEVGVLQKPLKAKRLSISKSLALWLLMIGIAVVGFQSKPAYAQRALPQAVISSEVTAQGLDPSLLARMMGPYFMLGDGEFKVLNSSRAGQQRGHSADWIFQRAIPGKNWNSLFVRVKANCTSCTTPVKVQFLTSKGIFPGMEDHSYVVTPGDNDILIKVLPSPNPWLKRKPPQLRGIHVSSPEISPNQIVFDIENVFVVKTEPTNLSQQDYHAPINPIHRVSVQGQQDKVLEASHLQFMFQTDHQPLGRIQLLFSAPNNQRIVLNMLRPEGGSDKKWTYDLTYAPTLPTLKATVQQSTDDPDTYTLQVDLNPWRQFLLDQGLRISDWESIEARTFAPDHHTLVDATLTVHLLPHLQGASHNANPGQLYLEHAA